MLSQRTFPGATPEQLQSPRHKRGTVAWVQAWLSSQPVACNAYLLFVVLHTRRDGRLTISPDQSTASRASRV